jgi:GNAT superfamily N-acetyltransferase
MHEPFEARRGQISISTDPGRLDLDTVADMLTRAYWAWNRPRERTERALQNSLVFGLYDGEKQIGMARVVTDSSVFAYLCDVFILEEYRHKGLGKWLLETIVSHPDLKEMRRWMLTTDDAHGLYRQFGFEPLTHLDTWMEHLQPYPGEEGD